MKLLFLNDPTLRGETHERDMKYIPEGYEIDIAEYYPAGDNTEFYAKLAEADAVLNEYVYLGKKEIDAMKNIKCISFKATGFNEVDLEYATQKGIPVASILDYCTQETAENAIATMMSLQRNTHLFNRSIQTGHVWDQYCTGSLKRVEGQTMSIIGLGRIGRHVAKIAGRGLGMKILAYDPYLPQAVADEVGATLVDFDTALAEADVVSIHMNLTDENVHMFNKDAFRKMKKCPLIINEGRGPMVSEEDLAWALDEGLVSGAGLDMLESEFPTAEYIENCPLVGRDNVIINPHSGWLSDTSIELICKIAIENAVAVCEGRFDDVCVIRNGITGK